MFALETLVVFVGATLALALTPGPDMIYIVTRSASEGRSAGVISVLGVSAGLLVHTAAVALGLSALLTAVPLAYDAVRLLGAAYLIYLGARMLLRPTPLELTTQASSTQLRAVFFQGMVTNILNPKVALFFLAFLPQFVDPTGAAVVTQLLVLGLVFNTLGSLVNLVAALLASRSATWLRQRTSIALAFERLSGGVLVALGLRLALSER